MAEHRVQYVCKFQVLLAYKLKLLLSLRLPSSYEIRLVDVKVCVHSLVLLLKSGCVKMSTTAVGQVGQMPALSGRTRNLERMGLKFLNQALTTCGHSSCWKSGGSLEASLYHLLWSLEELDSATQGAQLSNIGNFHS